MKSSAAVKPSWPVMMALSGLLAGCGSTTPPSFYALQPLPAVYAPGERAGYEEGMVISVGPVLTPEYLDRPQIAVVADGPEVFFSEGNRWAAPVEENVENVLVQNLGALLSTCRIVRFPSTDAPDSVWRVAVHVSRFDGEPGGKAVLDALWLVSGPGGDKVLKMQSVLLEETVAEKNYTSLVKAESALLGELSRRIADTIRALDPAKGSTP